MVASLTAVALVVPEFDQLGRAKNKWSPFSLRRNDIQLKQDDGKKRGRKIYRSTRKWSRLSFFFARAAHVLNFPIDSQRAKQNNNRSISPLICKFPVFFWLVATQYLSKKNRVLRQAAESRLRLCEQLELTGQELERAKSRISTDLEAERHKHHL